MQSIGGESSSGHALAPERAGAGTTDVEIDLAVVVTDVNDATPEVKLVTVRSAEGAQLPAWSPGAHIDLSLGNGLVRQYSLCSPTADRLQWRIGVLRDAASRGGSAYVHDAIAIGDTLEVRGPRNHFVLAPSESYVFVAGGIGVTPLIEMAREAERRGANWEFIYCGRNRQSMALLEELEVDFGSHMRVHTDAESGFFDFAGEFADPRESTHIYACGPGPFLDAIVQSTDAWPKGSVHFERFSPIEFVGEDTEFEIELARMGRTLTVPPDRSVLDVLRSAGVPVLSSCAEGTCGTCEVAVLDGDIEHRDSVLSVEEQESGEMMMVCVSRCRGRKLLLDL